MTLKENETKIIGDQRAPDGENASAMRRRKWTTIPSVAIALLALTTLAQEISLGQPGASGASQAPSSHLQMKKSNALFGFKWLGNEIAYPPAGPEEDKAIFEPVPQYFAKAGYQIHGDTFPMTWADDDEIYTSAGDPAWGGKNDGLDAEKFSGMPPRYSITRVNPMRDFKGIGGGGTKPAGMICVNGVLYLAFQNLLGMKPPVYGPQDRGSGVAGQISQHGSDASIVSSRDHGKTWTPSIKDIKEPMFPGSSFGGPAFVNTGRDNSGAPDSYVYAVSTDQWDNGSKLRVGRVPADRIQDASAWEWISELKDYKQPQWSNKLQKAVPVFVDDRRISLPDMVYVASIHRYLLLTWRLHKDFSPDDGTELMIYDAPHPWGPFTLVHHETIWESVEVNPYCPRLPLKWLTLKGNVLTGWIQFSGSWRKDSLEYRSHVRQFTMKVKRSYLEAN